MEQNTPTKFTPEQITSSCVLIKTAIEHIGPCDETKTAFAICSTLPKDQKDFLKAILKKVNSVFGVFPKNCVCPVQYENAGGLDQLYKELKAVCHNMDFSYSWAYDFIIKNGTNKNPWHFEQSGQLMQNPVAIFTNWSKSKKLNEGLLNVP